MRRDPVLISTVVAIPEDNWNGWPLTASVVESGWSVTGKTRVLSALCTGERSRYSLRALEYPSIRLASGSGIASRAMRVT